MFGPLTSALGLGARSWVLVLGNRGLVLRDDVEKMSNERLVVSVVDWRALRLKLETGELQTPT